MAHAREYPHESSCGQPSSRTNFSFEIGLHEVNPVVQLVQNGGSVGSFRSTGFASIFFSSTFGLQRCSVDQCLDFGEWHAGWLFEPVAEVDGNRFSSNWRST